MSRMFDRALTETIDTTVANAFSSGVRTGQRANLTGVKCAPVNSATGEITMQMLPAAPTELYFTMLYAADIQKGDTVTRRSDGMSYIVEGVEIHDAAPRRTKEKFMALYLTKVAKVQR